MRSIKRVCVAFSLAMAAIGLPASGYALPIEVLGDGGFEATGSPQAQQLSWNAGDYGSWGVGDPLETVGAENGISPLSGAKMLSFEPVAGISSDIYQIVDVTAYAGQIDAGLVTADLSASYNATAATTMGLRLLGWGAAPLDFGGLAVLGGGVSNSGVDSDLVTWQEFNVNGIALTAGIRYLAFGMHAPTGAVAYADGASLLLNVAEVPEPGTLAIFSLGLAGLGYMRRRKPA